MVCPSRLLDLPLAASIGTETGVEARGTRGRLEAKKVEAVKWGQWATGPPAAAAAAAAAGGGPAHLGSVVGEERRGEERVESHEEKKKPELN